MIWSNGLRPVGSDSEPVNVKVGPVAVLHEGLVARAQADVADAVGDAAELGALRELADERERAADGQVVQQAVVHRQRVGDRVRARGLDAQQVDVAPVDCREADVDRLVADVAVVQVVVGRDAAGAQQRILAVGLGQRVLEQRGLVDVAGLLLERVGGGAASGRAAWAACGPAAGASGAAGPGGRGLGVGLRVGGRRWREEAARERQRRARFRFADVMVIDA